MKNQHPLFIKYTRPWLHEVTGYSKGYLSRVATGKLPLNQSFIGRVCFMLKVPPEELFLLDGPSDPAGPGPGSLSQWLVDRCKRERLSLREATARVGVSHAAISDIMKGSQPSPETMRKLAEGFATGPRARLALEDELLVLAGYRSPHPEDLSELQAEILDKIKEFDECHLKMMGKFADFLIELKRES